MTSSYPELYTKNVRVWIKHPTEVWQCAVVQKDFDKSTSKLYVANEELEEICLEVKDNSALPHLRNPDILIGANDLTSLSYLHEPSVLYNLRVRFLQHNSIYTWCGIVLVAVNPFCDLEIYGEETIQTYHSNYALSQLDPHIYAVAEDAFTKLERNELNQSVIVSGESGAGKTVSAKFAMRYFASIAGSDSNIEARVLASNPIMEAIGNAKTVRNDNSSRFGKYIQILLDRKSSGIMGGNMRTYLLEKSRVTYQGEGERNFHIFYQLCSWAKKNNLDYLGLADEDFTYLGSNEKTPYDDMTKFIEALDTLGFSDKQKNVIYAVIAAILHGGNVEFESYDEDKCGVSEDTENSFKKMCELLSVNATELSHWLTNKLLASGSELIVKPMTLRETQNSQEAMLKFIYEKLFLWIVNVINLTLGPSGQLADYQFIGVLDIYGFEHFETNSFEQFCINYANEVLQQQFNLHVFKLEQEEYVREGIDWQFITFNDNQVVIDLIETKPIGILSLLDEESRFPRGTDESWCAKLFSQLSVNDVFKKPKIGWKTSFVIQHFADVVTYSVPGFLEKNRDKIEQEQVDLLKKSPVLEALFSEDGTGQETKKGAGGKTKIMHLSERDSKNQRAKNKATVGSQFRESLEALMKILNSTEPHYVRCIKPNDNKGAFEFNNVRAVQQLRACGVLETIRISSNGFPSRWSYQDFANRYRVLRVGYQEKLSKLRAESVEESKGPKPTPRKLVRAGSNASMEIRQICEDIVKIVYEEKVYSHFNITRESENSPEKKDSGMESELRKQRQLYQFGKTKIFFRPGQVALLERIRSQKLRECAILMQRMVRGWLVRRRYLQIKQSVLLLQRFSRGYLARKLYLHLKQTRAATIIQTAWRAYHQRKVYLQIRHSVLAVQTCGRAFLARKRYEAIRQNLAAITIQRYWRGYAARKKYQDTKKKIVLVQSCIRRHLAKKELRQLRVEARSVEHVTNLNKGLEKKIIELQQRIDEMSEETRLNRLIATKYDALRADFEAMEAANLKLKTREKEDILAQQQYKSENDKLMAINQELVAKVETLVKKSADMGEKLKSSVIAAKQSQVDTKTIEEAIKLREEQLRQEFERERKNLQIELERETSSKQQLMSRNMDLESKLESTIDERDSERAAVAAASVALATSTPPVFAHHHHLPASLPTPSTLQVSTQNGTLQQESSSEVTTTTPSASIPTTTPTDTRDFDTNLQQISVMMRCTELEQEMSKLKNDNLKLRRQIARSIDSSNAAAGANGNGEGGTGDKNQAAQLLAEQFGELQEELERYKKERADLKKVILIEDWITTSGGSVEEKYQNDLLSAYKSLYTQLDEQINKKDKFIQKLKNENIYLKMSGNNKSLSLNPANSSYLSLDPTSLETMDIDPSICYLGMFKFKQPDIDFIIRFLVYDVGPQNTFKCDAQTVAYIAYMCIRYIDHINNEEMIQRFMIEFIAMLRKKASMAIHKNALESIVHVLSIAFKIATLLKYYSEYDINSKQQDKTKQPNNRNSDSGFSGASAGDDHSINSSNGGPNENGHQGQEEDDCDFSQSLKNFDLTDFTNVLKDLIIWIYLKLIKLFQTRINNLIVPALLEHEELASSGMNVQKSIHRSGSISSERESPSPTEKEIHTLIKELSNMETMFRMHKLDEDFVFQFFKQVYYFIGAVSLNNLLMRKDLCNNNKAIQIIYNLSYFEQFLREHNIPNWEEVKSMLDAITQANKLLITNKSDKQISAIIQTTQALSVPQIVKIINMYTASDEEQISSNFIKNLANALQKDRHEKPDDPNAKVLIMQTQSTFPLRIPYIDDTDEDLSGTGTSTAANAAVVSGVQVNLKEIELPLLLKGLERYLEKI